MREERLLSSIECLGGIAIGTVDVLQVEELVVN